MSSPPFYQCTEDSKLSEDVTSSPTLSSAAGKSTKGTKRAKGGEEASKASRLRRKSLESSGTSDSLKAAMRINNLEAKVCYTISSMKNNP